MPSISETTQLLDNQKQRLEKWQEENHKAHIQIKIVEIQAHLTIIHTLAVEGRGDLPPDEKWLKRNQPWIDAQNNLLDDLKKQHKPSPPLGNIASSSSNGDHRKSTKVTLPVSTRKFLDTSLAELDTMMQQPADVSIRIATEAIKNIRNLAENGLVINNFKLPACPEWLQEKNDHFLTNKERLNGYELYLEGLSKTGAVNQSESRTRTTLNQHMAEFDVFMQGLATKCTPTLIANAYEKINEMR